MKVLFRDGYIETKVSGNTYCGGIANELMIIAQNISREYKVDFQQALTQTLLGYKQVKREYIKS